MKIHYLSCFPPHDPSEVPLKTTLAEWESRTDVEFTNGTSQNAEKCREHINSLAGRILDVLIIGGHGHDSLSGFLVREDPVR